LTQAAFHKAEVAAKAVLEEAVETYFPIEAWDNAFGSSGTVSAVAEVLGWGWLVGQNHHI
jgi:exopolyphosphatase / guanosine-5'-triphosphate,3'-diphosphate pyrophosphatase